MANTKSAKKRVLQNENRRRHNGALKSSYRTKIKKVEAGLKTNNLEQVNKLFREVVISLDKTVKKGILHKNSANRYKSRLSSRIKKLSTSQPS